MFVAWASSLVCFSRSAPYFSWLNGAGYGRRLRCRHFSLKKLESLRIFSTSKVHASLSWVSGIAEVVWLKVFVVDVQ